VTTSAKTYTTLWDTISGAARPHSIWTLLQPSTVPKQGCSS